MKKHLIYEKNLRLIILSVNLLQIIQNLDKRKQILFSKRVNSS